MLTSPSQSLLQDRLGSTVRCRRRKSEVLWVSRSDLAAKNIQGPRGRLTGAMREGAYFATKKVPLRILRIKSATCGLGNVAEVPVSFQRRPRGTWIFLVAKSLLLTQTGKGPRIFGAPNRKGLAKDQTGTVRCSSIDPGAEAARVKSESAHIFFSH